jgi:hypothetical protein
LPILGLTLFFFFIILIYAFFGLVAIGDMGGAGKYDSLSTNFVDFKSLLNIVYLFFTRDHFPEIMGPSFSKDFV